MKYTELRQVSQKDKDQQELSFEADQAKLQLQSDILATQKCLSEKRKTVVELKGAVNFNAQAIITAQTDVEALENGLTRLEALMAELF